VEVGQEIPALDAGPFSLLDFVRWAAYQENWIRLHYDREYTVQHLGLPDVVQSGHHRTALIVRMLTDWLGSAGELRRLRIRHEAVVLPGDAIRCGGRITGLTQTPERMQVTLQVWAARQDGIAVSEGEAVVDVTLSRGAR